MQPFNLDSDVTHDVIHNNESAAANLTEFVWIHLLMLQTISSELI